MLIRDESAGSRAVTVPCLQCGRMVRLAEAIIDTNGPAFRAYYHRPCARETFPSATTVEVHTNHGAYSPPDITTEAL